MIVQGWGQARRAGMGPGQAGRDGARAGTGLEQERG